MDVLIPVAIFAAMGFAVVYVLWRVFLTGGRLRRESQRYGAAADIARKADGSLGELEKIADGLRHGKVDAESAEPYFRKAGEWLRRYDQDVRTLAQRDGTAAMHPLIEGIERAERAVELIEHGRVLLEGHDHSDVAEAETTVKRGYLNLLHAREAIRESGKEMAATARGARR